MHTARFWMALAIPGGAPGYDDDKEFGNFITHMTARTSQRLRKHTRQTLKVKARGDEALIWSLAGFRTFGESKFNVCSHARARPPPSFRGARKREPGILRKDFLTTSRSRTQCRALVRNDGATRKGWNNV